MNRRKRNDLVIRTLFFSAGFASVIILLGIFLMLLYNGLQFFSKVGPAEFLLTRRWNPSAYGASSYGVLSMLWSTILVTVGAMAIAVPLGVGVAAYLSEIAPPGIREVIKPLVEMLAAIPSVAVGFLGIVLVGPAIARWFGLNNGLNALNGSVLLAVMALPTVITVAEDAIRSVPGHYKEASYALGATKWTTLVKVIIPASYSGIIAAIILGIGRAIGETMTVLMATGNAPGFPESYFDPVRTMTATIAIELGEVAFGSTHYYGLFAVGTLLFLISLLVNIIAERIAIRYRRKL
jgi:phosphate transport system permease protein